MTKKTLFYLFLMAVTMLLFAGCAPGSNAMLGTAAAEGEPAGFLLGLWHGCISFITFIISLFNDKVNVYEVHNNGGWYNFGFVLGLMIAYGGSGGGAAKKRRN